MECLGPSLNAAQVFAAIIQNTCGSNTKLKTRKRPRKSYNNASQKSVEKNQARDSISLIRKPACKSTDGCSFCLGSLANYFGSRDGAVEKMQINQE